MNNSHFFYYNNLLYFTNLPTTRYYTTTTRATTLKVLEKTKKIYNVVSVVGQDYSSHVVFFLISEYRVYHRKTYYIKNFLLQTHFRKEKSCSRSTYYILMNIPCMYIYTKKITSMHIDLSTTFRRIFSVCMLILRKLLVSIPDIMNSVEVGA